MAEHVLICQQTADGSPPTELFGWELYDRATNPKYFRKRDAGELGELAVAAAYCAISRGIDLTVGAYGREDLWTTSADSLEPKFRALRPSVIFCPQRPDSRERWIMSDVDGVMTDASATVMQTILLDTVWCRGGVRREGGRRLSHRLSNGSPSRFA